MNNDPIPVYRKDIQVSNVFSSLGELKETRLTAAIAYVMSRSAQDFYPVLKIGKWDDITDIRIEQYSEGNRYDIAILTKKKIIVIEAKLDFDQNMSQIAKYIRKLKKEFRLPINLVLLDRGSYASSSSFREITSRFPCRTSINFIEWKTIHKILKKIIASKKYKRKNPIACALAEELKNYMEVGGMSSDENKEIYCRDLSGDSMVLFFKYHLYACQKKFFPSAQGNQYFAPYFTRQATHDSRETLGVEIEEGISYIAPLLDIRVLQRDEVLDYLEKSKHIDARLSCEELLREQKRRKEILVLRLGKPTRLFLTPIIKSRLPTKKSRLPKGVGKMPARSFTFRELLEAASKGY